MVDDTQLARSKSIHRRTGKTFYYATKLLPKRVRNATYVLYAFFRVADEVVDDPGGLSKEAQRAELATIRDAALGGETDDEILAAFSELREQYGIPDSEVEQFIDAMIADTERSRYRSYEELEAYMRGSAAAVGVMMTHVMETDAVDSALPHARQLGKAFQLTNFLRDVREDLLERDRIYIPEETLEANGATVAAVERLEPTTGVRSAIRHELHRGERLYREGVAGIKYLPQDCQLPVLTAAVLYAEHHRLIRERGYDTLTDRPSLSSLRKLSLVLRTRWHWLWTKDPDAVFATVSGVPSPVDGRIDYPPNEPSPIR